MEKEHAGVLVDEQGRGDESWNWLEQVVLESKEEAAHKSLWSRQGTPFRVRECKGTDVFRQSS